MRSRTTVDLDESWIEVARELGTHDATDTVNAALREVLLRRDRRATAAVFREVRLDLDDEDVMSRAWR